MRKIITASVLISICALSSARTSNTVVLANLQKQYAEINQQVQQGHENLLRLEGAISLVKTFIGDEKTTGENNEHAGDTADTRF